METVVKIPAKRGRKPKIKIDETLANDKNIDIDIDTKNIKTVEIPEKIKAKRGRKPKIKQAENINKEINDNDNVSLLNTSNNDTIILKLHLDSIDNEKNNSMHKDEDRIKDYLSYNEQEKLESPTGYADNNTFSSNFEPVDCKDEEFTIINSTNKSKYKSDNNDNVCYTHTILEDFIERDNWPIGTDYACFWCCHKFNNTPFGIPFKMVNDKFIVDGCFCSLECSVAYNFSSQNSMHNIWESYSLINLLAHKLEYKDYVKSAPPREALDMFGGFMNITQFRNFCDSNKLINILNYPMISSQHQVEEISEQSINNNSRLYVPIDTDRIKKIEQKFKLIRQKPVLNLKNTLDYTMKLKIENETSIETPIEIK